jgi:hypothetical protein
MQPKNTICLWFERDALDAANFYAATFPDSKVTGVHKAPGDFPGGKKGQVLTVPFTVCGIPCMGINGGPIFKQSEAFSFPIEGAEKGDVSLAPVGVFDGGGDGFGGAFGGQGVGNNKGQDQKSGQGKTGEKRENKENASAQGKNEAGKATRPRPRMIRVRTIRTRMRLARVKTSRPIPGRLLDRPDSTPLRLVGWAACRGPITCGNENGSRKGLIFKQLQEPLY